MPNKQIVFADRMVGMSIQNGLVRIDLAVNAGTVKGKDDKPAQRMEITTQLVMPLEGFAGAVAMQDKALKEVVARATKARQSKSALPADSTSS